ncbi:hypothetical protein RVR_623 [Actinacidiphila reveromycinica]|uniref:Uncharacterized protein n=2 Tax=Actinacidiphila reveromycinica TaxID=659352 RepID=A0A7U3UNB1_9ACTN|nr:hypothetical protein RVR_623 [Streptomyces sp. SN-593]
MLTTQQADYLRSLAAPHVADAEGRRTPLTHLARRCRTSPRESWPGLVAAHYARSAPGPGPQALSARELVEGVRLRLLPEDALDPVPATTMSSVRELADGVLLALVLDRPGGVGVLTDIDVRRAGHDALVDAALARLARLPVEHEEVSTASGAVLHFLTADSPFTAGKALILGDVVRDLTGAELPDEGALVAMPHRAEVVYHPIVDGLASDVLDHLQAYVAGAHQAGAHPLSPRLYWWHRGDLVALTEVDPRTGGSALRLPAELRDLLRGMHRLHRAGRLAGRAGTDAAVDLPDLTRATARSVKSLPEHPEALAGTFAQAVALAHAACGQDPRAADADTWDAWATATQLGSALFTGTHPLICQLGEDVLLSVPACPAEPPADARGWLDALYLALVCRQQDRIAWLCRVPLAALRADDTVDAYVLHWIDTLQTYFTVGAVCVPDKLLAALETSVPEQAGRAPGDFVTMVDRPPVALFHRLVTKDADAFAEALADAVAQHTAFWGDSDAPRSRVALGALAMACVAHDQGLPVDAGLPYLPRYLVGGERVEDIP